MLSFSVFDVLLQQMHAHERACVRAHLKPAPCVFPMPDRNRFQPILHFAPSAVRLSQSIELCCVMYARHYR